MSTVKNIRSSVKDKLPLASQIDVGQIALNLHPDSACLAFKDKDDNIVVIRPQNVWQGTLEEYNAIETKDPNTTYYIVEN